MNINYKIISSQIKNGDIPLPEYATNGSAGMDLRACIESPFTLNPGETKLIPSGIAIHLYNSSYMGQVVPRSGLGYKHGIILANTVGIIDSDYQGQIFVPLYNRSKEKYKIEIGERIAQIIFTKIIQVNLNNVKSFDISSDRGQGGFGHSGRS